MDEVGGALIGIALVLSAVFIPAAMINGISGQFYRQFALTIATATIISCIISLTLSPALAAQLLRTHTHEEPKPGFWTTVGRPINAFFSGFNRGFDKLSQGYGGLTRRAPESGEPWPALQRVRAPGRASRSRRRAGRPARKSAPRRHGCPGYRRRSAGSRAPG